ncbi:hypothetical protein ACF0H5_006924 [Mactra antiquata]
MTESVGPLKRIYKQYVDNPLVSVPKRTRRRHLKMFHALNETTTEEIPPEIQEAGSDASSSEHPFSDPSSSCSDLSYHKDLPDNENSKISDNKSACADDSVFSDFDINSFSDLDSEPDNSEPDNSTTLSEINSESDYHDHFCLRDCIHFFNLLSLYLQCNKLFSIFN